MSIQSIFFSLSLSSVFSCGQKLSIPRQFVAVIEVYG